MTHSAVMQAATDPGKRAAMAELLKKVAFADSINDAWFALAILTLAVTAALILARPSSGTHARTISRSFASTD